MNAHEHHVLRGATVATLEAKLASRLVHAAARVRWRQELATLERRRAQSSASERAQFARLRRIGAVDLRQIEPVRGQVGLLACVQCAVEFVERGSRPRENLNDKDGWFFFFKYFSKL